MACRAQNIGWKQRHLSSKLSGRRDGSDHIGRGNVGKEGFLPRKFDVSARNLGCHVSKMMANISFEVLSYLSTIYMEFGMEIK